MSCGVGRAWTQSRVWTLSLSPTLVAMLGDPLLQARYRDYLGRRARLCEAEVNRHRDEPRLRALAQGYRDDLRRLAALYLDCLGGDLVRAFADLEAAGLVELMTTAATHGYPAPVAHPSRGGPRPASGGTRRLSRRLRPSEPGPLAPGVRLLRGPRSGDRRRRLRLFRRGYPRSPGRKTAPAHGSKGPAGGGCRGCLLRPGPGLGPGDLVADRGISGSPGLPRVPQRHRSVPRPCWLGDFLPHGVCGRHRGSQYHRVDRRDLSQGPLRPRRRCQSGGGRRRHLPHAAPGRPGAGPALGGTCPSWACPDDAESFGHWWHEGPRFLARRPRRAGGPGRSMFETSLGAYLDRHGCVGAARLAPSSWGEHGYNAAWLTRDTGWDLPPIGRRCR